MTAACGKCSERTALIFRFGENIATDSCWRRVSCVTFARTIDVISGRRVEVRLDLRRREPRANVMRRHSVSHVGAHEAIAHCGTRARCRHCHANATERGGAAAGAPHGLADDKGRVQRLVAKRVQYGDACARGEQRLERKFDAAARIKDGRSRLRVGRILSRPSAINFTGERTDRIRGHGGAK
jgi:hypothetical protein